MKNLMIILALISLFIGCISSETSTSNLTDINVEYEAVYPDVDSLEITIITSNLDTINQGLKVEGITDTTITILDVPLSQGDEFVITYDYYFNGNLIQTSSIEDVSVGENISIKGPKGQDGVDGFNGLDAAGCSVENMADSVKIVCDRSELLIKKGEDGVSCSGNTIAEGFEVECGGVILDTIIDGINGTNGTDGIDGTNGTNGVDGTNGTNGTDGTSCSATIRSEGLEIECGGSIIDTITNGVDGTNGIDGESCSGIVRAEGLEITCGGSITDTIVDGDKGDDCNGVAISEGTEITCGGVVTDTVFDGAIGPQGPIGDPGNDATLDEHPQYTQDTIFTELVNENVNATSVNLGFKVNKLGKVQFSGELTFAIENTANSRIVFSFPVEYAPTKTVIIPISIIESDGTRKLGLGQVNTLGEIRIGLFTGDTIAAGASYNFSAISYQLGE